MNYKLRASQKDEYNEEVDDNDVQGNTGGNSSPTFDPLTQADNVASSSITLYQSTNSANSDPTISILVDVYKPIDFP